MPHAEYKCHIYIKMVNQIIHRYRAISWSVGKNDADSAFDRSDTGGAGSNLAVDREFVHSGCTTPMKPW